VLREIEIIVPPPCELELLASGLPGVRKRPERIRDGRRAPQVRVEA
jgi:hypothetical protein